MNRISSWWVVVWAWGSLLIVMAALGGLVGLMVSASWSANWLAVGRPLWHSVGLVSLALAVAVPVAVLTAASLHLLPRWPHVRAGLRKLVVALDGVPSVVVGFVAALSVPIFGSAAAVIALAAVAFPALTLALDRTMVGVEPEERLAATALGATSTQVLIHVVGPASTRLGLTAIGRSGLRIAGVVAPLLFIPSSWFEPLPLAAVRAAAAGDMSSAAAFGIVLLGVVVFGRAMVSVGDRRPTWRLP